ncbi:MAG TPA: type II secretion system protein GspK [Anaerohalosphaeraceae bacterium]|jgi:hypothetical protein|nr:type II secretion system protein GspK [Anaerohalosphaeraceae bacterium]
MNTDRKNLMTQSASSRRGLVLVVVMMILVVLTALSTALSLRLTQVRRRQNYMIDYQRARYACDSALKYMINLLPDQRYTVVPREGMPDFSDLFWMEQADYESYIRSWLEVAPEEQVQKLIAQSGLDTEPVLPERTLAESLALLVKKMIDPNAGLEELAPLPLRQTDPSKIKVPGPYGAPWPYVAEPIDLEMGQAHVSISVEDENAKMPLGWAVSDNKAAQAALTTFCEWMSMDKDQIEDLQQECRKIREEKTFVIDPQPILIKSRAASTAQRTAQAQARSTASRFRTSRQPPGQSAARTTPQTAQDQLRPAIAHAADFSKLFHSSLLDVEDLARPRRNTGPRNESPLRYLALWGSQEININTAPRQVLEAAFTFAGEPDKIAEAIIQKRAAKPFQTTQELENLIPEERSRIQAAAPYLTVQSSFFQIRIDSRCGNARCLAAATVFKDQKKVETLAVLYGR